MIREATKADIPRLVEMGRRFVEDSSYAGKMTVCEKHASLVLEQLIGSDGRLVLVHEANDRLDGMLGAFVFQHPFSGELVCGEMFWWVEPASRGSAGMRLFKALETWAREHDAKVLNMVAPSDRVGEFYERVGYDKVETTYQRRLQ